MTLALGYGSVAETQANISSREFSDWLAYDRLSPIGPERLDQLFAYLAWIIVRTMGGGKRAKVSDMVPIWPGERTVKTAPDWRDLKSKVVILNRIFGGDDKRKVH